MPHVSGHVLSSEGDSFPFLGFQNVLSTLRLNTAFHLLFAFLLSLILVLILSLVIAHARICCTGLLLPRVSGLLTGSSGLAHGGG